MPSILYYEYYSPFIELMALPILHHSLLLTSEEWLTLIFLQPSILLIISLIASNILFGAHGLMEIFLIASTGNGISLISTLCFEGKIMRYSFSSVNAYL